MGVIMPNRLDTYINNRLKTIPPRNIQFSEEFEEWLAVILEARDLAEHQNRHLLKDLRSQDNISNEDDE